MIANQAIHKCGRDWQYVARVELQEIALTGASLEAHLTELRRDAFTKAGATPINELPHLRHGQRVKVGGVIVARQHPPTAKGFAFLAVEDPGGMVNVVIAPDIYTCDRAAPHGLRP